MHIDMVDIRTCVDFRCILLLKIWQCLRVKHSSSKRAARAGSVMVLRPGLLELLNLPEKA